MDRCEATEFAVKAGSRLATGKIPYGFVQICVIVRVAHVNPRFERTLR